MVNFQKDLALLLAMAAIFSGLLSSVLGLDLAMGTSGGGEGNDDGDDTSGDDTSGDDTSGDDTSGDDTSGDDTSGDDTSGDDTSGDGDGTDNELQPDPSPCIEDPNAEGCNEDPCIEDPTLEGCEDPCIEDPTLEGCEDPCIEDPTLEGCEPSVDCEPSYPNICVPRPPPALNCNDISDRNFKVVGSDPHGFDGDNDGIGCEGSGGSSGSGGGSSGGSGNGDGSSTSTGQCQGQADCFRGTVTEIVDGDTIDINNVRVRLALANTPERGENGYSEAIEFVESVCSVGTTALVDEDDRQKEGSFGRLIGIVYCGDSGINNRVSLNELLLERGYAVIDQDFCTVSEVSSASWAQRYGC
jgi:Staphylococcal nuclease homologue